MRAYLNRLLVFLLLVTTTACSNPGEQTLSEAARLTERVVSLIEVYRCDPEALDAAVASMAESERRAISEIRRSSSDLQRALSASDRRALNDRWLVIEARLAARLVSHDGCL
ncbi:MAG: putative tellurite resistance protein B-like protein [Myxococcota bacterium]|jgi:uncharacterized tellurite resistance protein B-like protein